MTEFEVAKDLLVELRTLDIPHKHWFDNVGWDMVEALCTVVEKKTEETIQVANFASLSVDEVTTMDNLSWFCCHAYVVHKWERVPLLLALVRFIDGCGANNLIAIVLKLILQKGGLTEEAIGDKLILFGANGHPSSQGRVNGVITQLKKGYAPYLISMHCVAH